MKKYAFSLLEILIISGIISLGTIAYINHTKEKVIKNNLKMESSDIESIKKSLQAYAAIHGKLPYADSNNDGLPDTNTYTGTLPYKELQVSPNDKYGSKFTYDVTDSLTTTTTTSVCGELTTIANTTEPILLSENNSSSYNVAAVVISKGLNKTLDGINGDGDRTYAMQANSYNANSNDDKIIEITKQTLLQNSCNDSSGSNCTAIYKSCKELKTNCPNATSGTYNINPTGSSQFSVYCEMDIDGGGWTSFASVANSGGLFQGDSTYNNWSNLSYTYGTYDSSGAVGNYWRDYSNDDTKTEILFKTGNNTYWFTLALAEIQSGVDTSVNNNNSSNNFGANSCNDSKVYILFTNSAQYPFIKIGNKAYLDNTCDIQYVFWGENSFSDNTIETFKNNNGGVLLFVR